MQISQRAQRTNPSPTLAVTAKANRLKAEGADICSFAAGEPDFDTPDFIKEAAIRALADGKTKYTPSSGIDALKDAICAKFERDNGLKYSRENIIISVGAKHSLYNAFQTICDPGDEVLIPAPCWVTYPEQVKLADAVPIFVPCDPENDFQPVLPALAEAITPRTRAILVNSPGNPTGGVFSRETLEEIATLALKHNLYIISDEIYEKIIYDGRKHVSVASFDEEVKRHTITINGCSKAYSMTGWRIGYAAAEVELTQAMSRLQDQSTSNPTSIAQFAAVAALNGPEEKLQEMVRAFDARRRLIVDRLNAIPGVKCRLPGGAFYAFADVSGVYALSDIKGSDALADYLLDEARIAVIPGSGFGADDFIRLSYATSLESIEKGMERMNAAIRQLL
ncbi:MAG TPA: pyridoxal phosphate-dependent aminotransferase [Chthonomonadales bacterium]|nr:pyridoxal phosphate-dependent aminotransferase [Chthonomonadales bacterium]